MEESTTYQWIMKQGEIWGHRKLLLRKGRKQFGPPDEATMAAINGIENIERLERLLDRVWTVSTWQELHATR